MRFNCVDANWNIGTFSSCFIDTEEMGESSEKHEAIITAAVRESNKLGSDAVGLSGTYDNEPRVALGVDSYLC